MKAQVITRENPFDPYLISTRLLHRPRKIRALRPRGKRPAIAMLNGKYILPHAWGRKLRDGDVLMFICLARGGGGGGSNPLRMLLTIALLAFAPWAAGIATGIAAGATGVQGLILAGTTMGIQLAGAALINALMPVPRQSTLPSPSPTYTLQAQGNAARIEAPIPVQYGRVLSFPDLAAQPYWEYVGEEQFVYQLLCLGAGEYSIEEIRIEDTPIAAFPEIQTEIVGPHGHVTLFPTDVTTSVEVSGQELIGRKSGTWSRSGTTVTVTLTAHGFGSGQAKYLNFTTGSGVSDVYLITVLTVDTFTVTTPATGTSGACYIHDVLGGVSGFVASAAGTVAQRLSVDFVLPSGLFTTDGSGNLNPFTVGYHVEAQQVNDLGVATGSWTLLEDASITAKTVTAVRQSMSYTLVTPGRYKVRAWRTDAQADPSTTGNQLLVGGLRSYMADPIDFGPVTLVALRMRATNSLSVQASRKVAVLATRKIPVWNGTAWSAPVASTSIAWALADACRSTDYGAKLADARIDLAGLLALDAVWTARQDSFSYRFDSATSWWEAMRKIAAAGRAKPIMMGGVVRVVRDAPATVPVAMFSMRNIIKGSFAVDYLQPTSMTADAITGTYFDATTWAPRRVTAKLPGSTALKPAKVTLEGIDNPAQAMRELMYQAACNRYRRKIVHFGTEMEGFIPAFGDLIAVQHDMVGWGKQAEVVGWNAATRALKVSEPLAITGSNVVALRRANGSQTDPIAVTAGASDYEVILAAAPDFTPESGGQTRERTHVAFGLAATYSTMAKVLTCRPRGLYEVAIDAVTEDPSVHTAETGVVAPPLVTSNLPRRPIVPIVKGLFARRIPGDATRCVIGWRPAPGADTYHVEMAEGTDVNDANARWTRMADTSAATQAQSLLHSARTMIRVRGVGLTAGPWIAATLGSLIPSAWNTDATPAWTLDSNPAWSS